VKYYMHDCSKLARTGFGRAESSHDTWLGDFLAACVCALGFAAFVYVMSLAGYLLP